MRCIICLIFWGRKQWDDGTFSSKVVMGRTSSGYLQWKHGFHSTQRAWKHHNYILFHSMKIKPHFTFSKHPSKTQPVTLYWCAFSLTRLTFHRCLRSKQTHHLTKQSLEKWGQKNLQECSTSHSWNRKVTISGDQNGHTHWPHTLTTHPVPPPTPPLSHSHKLCVALGIRSGDTQGYI